MFTEALGEWNLINPKDTVENVKQVKIQHLFDNPKNTESMTSSQKNTDFPKNTLLIPVGKHAKSAPLGD